MIYEEFKPFILSVCLPSDHHHDTMIQQNFILVFAAAGSYFFSKSFEHAIYTEFQCLKRIN